MPEKPLRWVGASRKEVEDLPRSAREFVDDELDSLRHGEMPLDWKPMPSVGPGACEMRVRTHEGGTVHHRVIYVAKFSEAVYVLHVFQKTSRKTAPQHAELARVRYRALISQRRERGEQ